jgi:predicted MFS family arabinose efflux permease
VIARIVGWLALFVVGTDLFVISPLLPGISRGLGVGTSAAGWTVTTFSLAYLIGAPTLGALADRIGHRRVLTVALLVFAAANLLTGLAGSLAVLLVARGVAGLAASGITPSVYAMISRSSTPDRRARSLAVATSGLLLALATGAPAGSVLAAALGWHGVFFVLAVAALVVLVLVLVFTGDETAKPTGRVTVPHSVASEGLLVRLRAVSVTGLWALSVYGVYTFLGAILTDTRQLTASLIAGALVCYGIGAICGNLAGGWLTDRFGGRRVSIATLLLLAAATAALGLALYAPIGTLFAALGVFAVVAYPYFSAQQARLISRFPTMSGSLLGWNNTAMYAGILLASVLGGPLLENRPAHVLIFSASATALLAAVVATASVSREHEIAAAG